MHEMQALAKPVPTAVEYLPTGQSRQSDATELPTTLEYLPAPHAMYEVADDVDPERY